MNPQTNKKKESSREFTTYEGESNDREENCREKIIAETKSLHFWCFYQLYLASMSFASYFSAASSQLRSCAIPRSRIFLNSSGLSRYVASA